ncbi:hypothetical protein RB195_026117 [Necator americanus]|uniref:Uncharacterized protein n=1 Tax=Necator americanus TaxID=51031 RepID=A0ABR1EVG0_NECAM
MPKKEEKPKEEDKKKKKEDKPKEEVKLVEDTKPKEEAEHRPLPVLNCVSPRLSQNPIIRKSLYFSLSTTSLCRATLGRKSPPSTTTIRTLTTPKGI